MRHSLVRAGGAFLRPGQAIAQRRAQARSRMAAWPPRLRRAASLTAPSTAVDWNRNGTQAGNSEKPLAREDGIYVLLRSLRSLNGEKVHQRGIRAI